MRSRRDASCVYVCNSSYRKVQLQQQQHCLPVATPALKREHPNLFCVYARIGEEKETQTQVFWELIRRAYLRAEGCASRSLTR